MSVVIKDCETMRAGSVHVVMRHAIVEVQCVNVVIGVHIVVLCVLLVVVRVVPIFLVVIRRQIAYLIYEYFRVTGANNSVDNYADLFTIVLRNDDIQEFDSKRDETLLSTTNGRSNTHRGWHEDGMKRSHRHIGWLVLSHAV